VFGSKEQVVQAGLVAWWPAQLVRQMGWVGRHLVQPGDEAKGVEAWTRALRLWRRLSRFAIS
jgi:hypothetical protein